MSFNCPSCGGPLPADERFAQLVVCGYCRSSIILDQRAARVAGEMNALIQTPGPLYVGATGRLHNRRFSVLGRVRYGYANGCWDEWFLLFEDQTPMWVSEDERNFSLETLRNDVAAPVAYESAAVGQIVSIAGETYHIDERDVATCEGGEGQLPFVIEPGAKTPFLDLSAGDRFATIEFDQSALTRREVSAPRVFTGRRIDVADLQVDVPKADWARRDALSAERAATDAGRERIVRSAAWSQRVNCAACGAALAAPNDPAATTLTCGPCRRTYDLTQRAVRCVECATVVELIGGDAVRAACCPKCGTGLNLSTSEPTTLGLMRSGKRPNFLLKLSDPVKRNGETFRVAGVLRYVDAEHGPTYSWDEYLLYSPKLGYRYLVCENGHWSWCEEVNERPGRDPRDVQPGATLKFLHKTWTVFESRRNGAKIDWVEGELPWVAKRGDAISYLDAAHPPELLSISWTPSELEYYRSTYLSPTEIATMLGLPVGKLPWRSGIAPHQPYVVSRFRREAVWVMLALAGAAMMLGMFTCSVRGERVAEFSLGNTNEEGEFLSPSFTITRAPSICSVRFEAPDLRNSWTYLEVALVNEVEQALLDFSAEMSNYSGVDGGEAWSEDHRTCRRNFRVTQPGEYRFLVQGVHGVENGPQATTIAHEVQATVNQAVGIARYYWALAAIAAAWVGFEGLSRGIHAARQRANIESDDDDDD